MTDNPTTADPQANSGETPNQDTGKTFTQAELDSMVTARLSKAEKAFERRLQDELKKAEDRAKLGDIERLQAERDDLAKQLEAARAETTEALMRAQLAKHVTDVDYALYKVQQNTDKYVDKDGNVKVETLVKDTPTLAPQPDPRPGPAPTTGGGGGTRGFDMNAAIRHAAGRQ